MQITTSITFEEGADGWVVASVPAVAGVFSQGRSREEARANVIDALALMLATDPANEHERLRITIEG